MFNKWRKLNYNEVTNISNKKKLVALKAADFIKVDDDTNALCANLSNKIVALKIDTTAVSLSPKPL